MVKKIFKIGLIIIILIIFFFFYPFIYDKLIGGKKLEQHIQEILGNETNHELIVPIILDWIETNVYYPSKEEEFFTLDNGFGFYKINGRIRFFYRGAPASWIIKTRLGRCGEDTIYFTEVMNELGYESRKITPLPMGYWDHSWAEYFTKEGYKIIVDPSSGRIIEDPRGFTEGANFLKIEAEDLEGNKEDVTSDYRYIF